MTPVPAQTGPPGAGEQWYRLTALEEADRGRAALFAAVSHDLRAPLAAATAAVSGLRVGDALTSDDRATGERARARTPETAVDLTPQEARVADLVAAGRRFPGPGHG